MSLATARRADRGPSLPAARATSTYRGLLRCCAAALLLAAGAGCGDSVTAPGATAPRPPAPSATIVADPSLSDRYPAEWNVFPDSNPAGFEPAYAIRVGILGNGSEITSQVVTPSGYPLYGTATHIALSLTDAAEAAALRARFDVLIITIDPFNTGGTYNNVSQAGLDAYLDAGGGVILEDAIVINQLYGAAYPQVVDPARTYRFPSAGSGFTADPALTRQLEGALALGTLTLQAYLHSTLLFHMTPFIATPLTAVTGGDGYPVIATAAAYTERAWGAGNTGGRLIVQGFSLGRACTEAQYSCNPSIDRMLLYNELRWVAKNAIEQPPRADAGGNAGAPADVHYAGTEGSAVAFTGRAFDNEFGPGIRLTTAWDFESDGTVDATAQSTMLSDILEGSRTWADDGAFTATFSATDASGVTRSKTVPVRVANVAPAVTAESDVAIEARRSLTLAASFTDPGADDPWTYTVLWGDEAAGASPVATTLQAPGDFAPSHTYATPGVYDVTVEVTDKDGGKGSATLQVTVRPPSNVAPAASAGGPYTGNEGASVALDAGGSTDPDGDALTYAWDLDGDGAYDDATGVSASETFADNGTYTVGVQVSDEAGLSHSATATVTVGNVAPTLGAVSFPTAPVAEGTPVSVSAAFTDPGSADTHSADVQWDINGAWESAAVSGGAASATKTLPAGVYTVTLRVTDDDGGVDDQTTIGYVVVYDPNDGFVTGGGWINSGAGDCTLTAQCAGAAGKSTFGFVSKYHKGASAPSGNTEFDFKAGSFRFKSTSYEWLVIAGAKAKYKGEGQVNGAGSYRFMITAIDGAVNGGGGVDRFRIKVWDTPTGAVVYDNQRGAEEDSDATTALGGGSVVIHK